MDDWVLLGSGKSIQGAGLWQPAACLQMKLAHVMIVFATNACRCRQTKSKAAGVRKWHTDLGSGDCSNSAASGGDDCACYSMPPLSSQNSLTGAASCNFEALALSLTTVLLKPDVALHRCGVLRG